MKLVAQAKETTVSGSKVYFVANLPTTGNELWVSSGAAGDARMLGDQVAGTGGLDPGWIAPLGDGRVLLAGNPSQELRIIRGLTADRTITVSFQLGGNG